MGVVDSKNILINKAYDLYTKIESAEDLEVNGISLTDYHTLPVIINSLIDQGYADCLSERAAKWLRKVGFNVLDPNTSENRGIMYKVIANG